MAVELRVPGPADVARLESIENAADTLFIDRFHPDVWWPARSGEERVAAGGVLLVAAEGMSGETVGFVHLLEVDGLAHLEQLSVLPERGRQGVGRALVRGALDAAAARGYGRVTLRTYADVPWNAPFYRASGFVESEPDRPFLHGLVAAERRIGLERYGRRIQMTATLPDRP